MPENEPVIAYLVRHGTTKANEKHIFRGWRNYPLDEQGHQTARDLGEWFKDKEIGSLHTSDLARAHETAQIIGNRIGKTPQTTMQLRPWNIGMFAGMDKEDHQEHLDQYRKSPGVKIPGGESLNTFRGRFRKWFVPFLENEDSKPMLAVTSASNVHEAANILHGNIDRGEMAPGGVAAIVRGERGPELRILKGHRRGGAAKTS